MLLRQDAIIGDFDFLPLGWWLVVLLSVELSGFWNLGRSLLRLSLRRLGLRLLFALLLLLVNLLVDGLISSESQIQEPEHVSVEWQRI